MHIHIYIHMILWIYINSYRPPRGENILSVCSSLAESAQYGCHQGHQFSAKEMASFFFMNG